MEYPKYELLTEEEKRQVKYWTYQGGMGAIAKSKHRAAGIKKWVDAGKVRHHNDAGPEYEPKPSHTVY